MFDGFRGLLWLAVAPAPGSSASLPAAGALGFWAEHGDAVVVAVVIGLFTIFLGPLLRDLTKHALVSLWTWLRATARGQGGRFRKRYLRAMAERHGRLRLIGIYNNRDLYPPRLREAFVQLRLATGNGDGPRLDWRQAFGADKKRVVILGAPGAGKSTLLDYLALALSGGVPERLRETLGAPLPLFARLRELGEERKGTLLDLLRASAPFSEVPAHFPQRDLDRGRAAVLLDGLDEVLDPARHERAVEEIRKFVEAFPRNLVVVTCRIAGWRGQLADPDPERGFLTYEVQPFDRDDVRRFVSTWYREVFRATAVADLVARSARPATETELRELEERVRAPAAERAEDLLTALKRNENLTRIAETPLLLSLVTLVHYHRVADLPKGRAQLYGDCLRILLEEWDKQRLVAVAGPSLKEKRLVLKEIAFDFLAGDRLQAGMPDLERLVEPLLPKVEAKIGAEALLRQIVERSGILVEMAIGRYAFAHRALHDALAAEWLVEHERDDLLLAHAGEERWREVILIAAGQAPAARARKLVQALLETGNGGAEQEVAALQIAGYALAEDIQMGDDLRGQVRQRLAERLSREESAGTFGRLSSALLAGDPEAAREWMEKSLGGEGDPVRQKRLLGLLPALGEEHSRPVLPVLGRLTGDGAAIEDVRIEAALACAAIGGGADGDVLSGIRAARATGSDRLKAAATWAFCELGLFEQLGLVKVPAGEFLMGTKDGDEGADRERPQHTLDLPTFYLGKTPVTVAQFRSFLAPSWGSLDDFDSSDQGGADHPVVEVSWYDALAYARAQGMSLPSEAEWEKAARGTDGRIYPWGNEWNEGRANFFSGWGLLAKSVVRRTLLPGTTPVGRYSPAGDSPYGCADMAGNVWEWTRSLWGEDSRAPRFGCPYVATDGREDLDSPSLRVLRGGAFHDAPSFVRCAVRAGLVPDSRLANVGFRVVLSPFRSGL